MSGPLKICRALKLLSFILNIQKFFYLSFLSKSVVETTPLVLDKYQLSNFWTRNGRGGKTWQRPRMNGNWSPTIPTHLAQTGTIKQVALFNSLVPATIRRSEEKKPQPQCSTSSSRGLSFQHALNNCGAGNQFGASGHDRFTWALHANSPLAIMHIPFHVSHLGRVPTLAGHADLIACRAGSQTSSQWMSKKLRMAVECSPMNTL